MLSNNILVVINIFLCVSTDIPSKKKYFTGYHKVLIYI